MSSAIPRFRVFVARREKKCDERYVRRREKVLKYTLVCTLLKLLVLGSLIDELQNLISKESRHKRLKIHPEARKTEKPKRKMYLIVQLG